MKKGRKWLTYKIGIFSLYGIWYDEKLEYRAVIHIHIIRKDNSFKV